MRVAAVVLAAAFAAVAALDATGVFRTVDAYAVHHLMPGLDPAHSSAPSLRDSLEPFGDAAGPGDRAADLWLYPASAPVAALLVAVCCCALWRRRRRRAAVLWAAALVVGVAVELLVKHVVQRPALHAEGHHIVAFDGSLPSGHALRATIVAAAITYVWRRTGAAATAWAVSVLPLLILAGWHTPSDVLAGLVLALALVATTLARLRVA